MLKAAATLLSIWVVGSKGTPCSSELSFVSLSGPAVCGDGSQAGYFAEVTPDAREAVLYLGDGPICGSEAECSETCDPQVECEGIPGIPSNLTEFNSSTIGIVDPNDSTLNTTKLECLQSKLQCSSSFYEEQRLNPATLLCRDDEFFGNMSRYYVPHCSLDWWLGTGSTAGNFTFAGSIILEQVLEALPALDTLIVVTSGGAGAGVLNNLETMKLKLPGVEVLTVLDSSWKSDSRTFDSFFSQQRKGNMTTMNDGLSDRNIQFFLQSLLADSSKGWITDASLNSQCRTKWENNAQFDSTGLENCLMVPELVTYFTQDDIFFIQSQYDMSSLSTLGLEDGNIRTIRDSLVTELDQDSESVVAIGINSFVEAYGRSQRVSVDRMQSILSGEVPESQLPNHFVYLAACGHHNYLPPTELHVAPLTRVPYGDTAKLLFNRPRSLWETLYLEDDVSLRTSLTNWVSNRTSTGFNVVMDRCGSFLCNTMCPTKVEALRLELTGELSLTTPCSQLTDSAYAFLIILAGFISMFMVLLRVLAFRHQTTLFWQQNRESVISSDRGLAEVQLVQEIANDKSRHIQLMVRDLSYWVSRKTSTFKRAQEGDQVQILRNVNLNFPPGSVHALMGPSGSGKSTLLDLISLTRDSGVISGRHYINGVPSSIDRAKFLRTWLQNNLSYVRQQDVLFPNLTVRQHLEHSAWLMLPEYMPYKKKLLRVSQVVKLLELEDCLETRCGDGGVKYQGGISGGQRRRVSVATQLLRMPAALMLDEPTTGLDSTNALLLVRSLHTLAHKGNVAVTMTLHQPRREIYDLLDVLTILHRGRVVYSGPPHREAIKHFGLSPDEHNISDEILDRLATMGDSEVENLQQRYLDGPLGRDLLQVMENEQTYLTSSMATRLQDILVNNALAEGRWSWGNACSVSTITWVLMSRTLARGGLDIHRTVPLSALGGVLVGLVFVENTSYTGFASLLYLGVSTMTFLQGTFLGDRYQAEKRMYDYEKNNGTRIPMWSLLMSQFVRNAVTSTLEGAAFSVPVYFIGGLTVDRFQEYFLVMALTSMVCIAQATFVEILFLRKNSNFAASVTNMGVLSLNALFNGFIVQLKDIPVYYSWLPYLMMSFWSFSGVLVNQFASFSLPCDKSGALECAVRTGDNLIRSFEFENQDPYIAMFALMIFLVVYLALSVVVFYLRNVYGQRGRIKVNRDAERIRRQRQAQLRANSGRRTGQTMQAVLSGTDKRTSSPNPAGGKGGPNGFRTAGENRVEAITNNHQSRLVSILLSRQTLVFIFLVDIATALYICGFTSVGLISQDLTVDFTKIELDLSGTQGTFIGGNLAVLSLYVLQFLFQLVFLIPRKEDGSRLGWIWISWWDVSGLLTLAGDAVVTIVLLSLRDLTVDTQVFMVILIRSLRFVRVFTYWKKVSTFHRVRSVVYRGGRGLQNSQTESGSTSSAAGIDPFTSHASSYSSSSAFQYSNVAGNRHSGFRPLPGDHGLMNMFQQQGVRASRAVWQKDILDEI